MKRLKIGLFVFVAVVVISIIIALPTVRSFNQPADNPDNCLTLASNNQKIKLVALGDSITHGVIGHNYVSDLRERLGEENYEIFNGGINGDLTYNLVQRLDSTIACQPDLVTVLIGTNDVLAGQSSESAESYIEMKSLPQPPTRDTFLNNYRLLLEQLTTQTSARIAVMSLPLVGENLASADNLRSQDYSAQIKALAAEFQVSYLPLNEQQSASIAKLTAPFNGCEQNVQKRNERITNATISHYALLRSWEEISDEVGMTLHIDCVHLNSRATKDIVSMVEQFVVNP